MPCQNRHVFALTTDRQAYICEQEPGCCNMLNQNKSAGRGISSTPAVLHTILRNPGLQFSEKPKDQHGDRWFTKSELLISQNFPVTAVLGNVGSKPARCCSFCPGGKLTAAGRTKVNVARQAGNSMNVSVSGVVTLFALLFVKRTDQISVARVWHQAAQGA